MMNSEGCTPVEVPFVLELKDYDLAVRCLEVICSCLPSIVQVGPHLCVKVIALCHHSPTNRYPALGVFGAENIQEVEQIEARINAWVEDQGLSRLVAQSKDVVARPWSEFGK